MNAMKTAPTNQKPSSKINQSINQRKKRESPLSKTVSNQNIRWAVGGKKEKKREEGARGCFPKLY